MTVTPPLIDIEVDRERTIKGTVGSIVVRAGGCLVLMGTAEGGVVVEGGGYARIAGTARRVRVAAGGHVVLVGTCLGDLVDEGGRVELTGHVAGRIIEERPPRHAP